MVPLILKLGAAKLAFLTASKNTPIVGEWIARKRHELLALSERGLASLEASHTISAQKVEETRANLGALGQSADSGWSTAKDFRALWSVATTLALHGYNSLLEAIKISK